MRTKTYREDSAARFTGKRGEDNQLQNLKEKLTNIHTSITGLIQQQAYLNGKLAAIAERLDAIEELLQKPEPEPEPEWKYWHEGVGVDNLRAHLSAFAVGSEKNRSYAYDRQPGGCKAAARVFVSWLSERYSDVKAVNEMQERHCYGEPDYKRHADAFVVMPDLTNPSRDFIIDFVSGVSEPGVLRDKLQHNITSEKPWRVDNAFEEGCP